MVMIILSFLPLLTQFFFMQVTDYEDIKPTIFGRLGNAEEVKRSYQDLLAIAAVSFLILNAMRYMIAKMFSDESGLQRAKAEIMDNIVVAVLVSAIYVLLQVLEFVTMAAYPTYFTGDEGPMGMIDGYIKPMLINTMSSAVNIVSIKSQQLDIQSSRLLKSVSFFGVPVRSMLLNEGIIESINKLKFEIALNATIAVGLSVAFSAVEYIKTASIYFLFIGFVIRSIPSFRGAGAFLIALSLGFYYIYPLVTAMFLFGIPRISFETSKYVDLQQSFCTMEATGAVIIPEQDISKGFSITLGQPQSISEDFGLIVSTNFLISQFVALSLTAMFINNTTLLLGKGLYTSVSINNLLGRLI